MAPSAPIDIPAINWLGYTLDMTTITPNDIKAVAAAVKKAGQLIDVSTDSPRAVTVDGVTYNVPKDIAVSTDIREYQGNYVTYPSGSQASVDFHDDSALFNRYLAVSGSPSAGYSISKTFRDDEQFALYSYNAVRYAASIKNYIVKLNEDLLESRVTRLKPFPAARGPDADVVRTYRAFFDTFGTHAIVSCDYGARFQLMAFATNDDPAVNSKFSQDVLATYGGIPSSGKWDQSIPKEDQYKKFQELHHKTISVQGGDPAMANTLSNNPTSYDLYEKWTKTNKEEPEVLNFSTADIFTLMREAASAVLQNRADDVQNAFNYFATHPQLYKTAVSLSVESDWAEFGLLTPSASIVADPDSPFPYDTVASQTKVTWGKEHSHDQKRTTLRFFVVNDGSPIDFSISHGTDGGRGANGRATAVIEKREYTNDRMVDNNWNTVWFYHVTVSSTPMPTRSALSAAPRTWNETLGAYLAEVKAQQP